MGRAYGHGYYAEPMTHAQLWDDAIAERIIAARAAAGIDPAAPIVCASGISPSGPIHMGNLREVFTTHLVAEALRRRGREVMHLHSWDDYDRFRKVPAGVDESFNQYVGMPLAAIPDPAGQAGSYAEHFMDEFRAALEVLGIRMTEVRQSRAVSDRAPTTRRSAGRWTSANSSLTRSPASRRPAATSARSRSAAASTTRSSPTARRAAVTTRA